MPTFLQCLKELKQKYPKAKLLKLNSDPSHPVPIDYLINYHKKNDQCSIPAFEFVDDGIRFVRNQKIMYHIHPK